MWNAPKARSEGAGRVFWKPGLTGPWRVVPDPSRGVLFPLPKALMKLMPRIVFLFRLMRRALRPNNPPSSSRKRTSGTLNALAWANRWPERPSSWNLLSAAEAEILCSKVCRLGKVTQVDQARAQIGVHRYLPEAGGVRIKWVLAYLDESGSLTTHEGTRPAHESISVKDVICKVDVNRDGVLAAASARKLDKGGYSLQEQVAVALCSPDPGLDVDKALAELLCESGSVLAASSKSHEMAQVEAWIAKFFRGGVSDILEVLGARLWCRRLLASKDTECLLALLIWRSHMGLPGIWSRILTWGPSAARLIFSVRACWLST